MNGENTKKNFEKKHKNLYTNIKKKRGIPNSSLLSFSKNTQARC